MIIEVQGKRLEVPDGLSQDQIGEVVDHFVSTQGGGMPAPQRPQSGMGKLEAAGANIAQGATFGWGDEIGQQIAQKLGSLPVWALKNALPESMGGEDVSLGQVYDYMGSQALKDRVTAPMKQFNEESPVIGGLTQAAGGLMSGGALASLGKAVAPQLAARLAALAKANSYTAAGGFGGVSGAVYGAGTGEGSLEERGKAAIGSGVAGAVAGPAFTFLGRNLVAPAAQRILRQADKLKSKLPATVQAKVGDIFDPAQEAAQARELMSQRGAGKVIPLSEGDRLQNQAVQSFESSALAGGKGEAAQQIASQFRTTQSNAALEALKGLQNGAVDDTAAVSGAVDLVAKQSQAAKAAINKAYQTARNTSQGVTIDADALANGLAKNVRQNLKDRGLNIYLPKGMENAQGLMSDLGKLTKSVKGSKITGVKLDRLEQWRSMATQAANDAYGSSEGVALKEMVNTFDDFMAELADGAIRNGDDTAIKAFKEARGLRARYGKLFESNQVVDRILKSKEPLTPEEITRRVIGAGQLNAKSDAGKIAKTLIEAADAEWQAVSLRKKGEFGPRAEDVRNALKDGILYRVISRSQGSTLQPGTETVNMSFPKLKTNLEGLLKNNKSLVDEVFTKEERALLNNLLQDATKAASRQPGAVNNSGTFEKLSALMYGKLSGLPFANIAAKSVQDAAGTRAAKSSFTQKTQKQVMNEIMKELRNRATAPVRYGGIAGGASGNMINQQEAR